MGDWFHFDRGNTEFELLEAEKGIPPTMKGGNPPEGHGMFGQRILPGPADSVAENEKRLKKEYRKDINPDILLRRFLLGGNIPCLVACINGMADGGQISDFILRQGMIKGCMEGAPQGERAQYALDHVFALQESELSTDWSVIKQAISEGRTAVFIEGDSRAVLLDTRGFESRGVEAAQNEKIIRGPQEGFNENIRTNITLLRRIIKTDDFICEFRETGGQNKTVLSILYREGVANPALVEEVKRRLAKVDTRMVLSDGTLEQLTERHPLSPIPQVLATERPDRVAAHIMQGHVAVICEGSPFVNVMPATIFSLMATSEDAYLRQPLGNVLRMVRYIGAVLSIVLPGYFLALALYHQGMLSTEVVSTLAQSRQMVYLPLGAEMLFLLWVFQLLREAGQRVPGAIGQAIGIIGGLILGQAAVSANMVSTVVLIIVALTGLGSFTIPDYSAQLAAGYFRFLLVIAAWFGGLLGLVTVLLLLTTWMASIKSFGVPFFAPAAPKVYSKRPTILRGRISNHKRAEDTMNTARGGSHL